MKTIAKVTRLLLGWIVVRGTPRTVVSSFSVAVLTSILPSGVFSFGCDLLGSPRSPGAIGTRGLGVGEKIPGEGADVACGRVFFSAMKTLKGAGFCARTFSRSA